MIRFDLQRTTACVDPAISCARFIPARRMHCRWMGWGLGLGWGGVTGGIGRGTKIAAVERLSWILQLNQLPYKVGAYYTYNANCIQNQNFPTKLRQ
jgi:hypothetical protein